MGEIVLHVGTHKTGSTTLQRTLHLSRKALNRRGAKFYPGHNHGEFYQGFTDTPQYFHRFYRSWDKNARQEEIRKKIRDTFEQSHGDVHIVSSEDISLLSEASLLELRNFLTGECAFEKVSVVCFLREPLDYLNSSLQQFIKPGLTGLQDILKDSFANYRLQGCPEFSGGAENILRQIYFPISQKLINAFGSQDVVFLKFEDAKTGGVTQSFLQSVFHDRSSIWLKEEISNESMSHEACILMAEYNDRNPLLTEDLKLNGKRVRNKEVIPALRKIEGRSASLIDMNKIDLDYVNLEIERVNDIVRRPIMTPIHDVPEKYVDNDFLRFSEKALDCIANLTCETEILKLKTMPKLGIEDLRRINNFIERRQQMKASLWTRFLKMY